MLNLPNIKVVEAVKDSLLGHKSLYNGEYQSFLSGHTVPIRTQFSPIMVDQKILGGIAIVEDLTEERQRLKTVEFLQSHDRLTNTYNRTKFEDFIFQEVKALQFPIALIIFDINAFQLFNTTFGYDVGNELLKTFAQTLRDVAATFDDVRVYRTGGDEFSIIAQNMEEAALEDLLSTIKETTKAIRHQNMELSTSFGYSYVTEEDTPLIKAYSDALSLLQEQKIYEGAGVSKKTVDIIMSTLFEKSPREKDHSERVSRYAEAVALAMNQNDTFVKRVALAGRLHDIGKINISETILDKPGRLTDDEYDLIKKHPFSGFKILTSVPEYAHIANIVHAHHERIDGKGYPRGLRDEDIPLEAKIIAVVDAYDAMTKQRTYRDPLSQEAAIAELIKHQGTQFDARIVNVFIDYLRNR